MQEHIINIEGNMERLFDVTSFNESTLDRIIHKHDTIFRLMKFRQATYLVAILHFSVILFVTFWFGMHNGM